MGELLPTTHSLLPTKLLTKAIKSLQLPSFLLTNILGGEEYMAVAVVRRDGESNEKVIGRWKKKTQKANVVKNARKARYFDRNESRTKQKEGAIVRERYRARRKKNQFYS